MTVLFTAPSEAKKDIELLQSDLDSVGSWEKTWLMQFNADKCFTMRAGRSKTIINKSYKLHDHPLQSTDSVKYLGLTLTSDLKFNTHINNVTAKANSILGLLRKNLKMSSQAVKTQAYQSLVRSHLEYAATVLSPVRRFAPTEDVSLPMWDVSPPMWDVSPPIETFRPLGKTFRPLEKTFCPLYKLRHFESLCETFRPHSYSGQENISTYHKTYYLDHRHHHN